MFSPKEANTWGQRGKLKLLLWSERVSQNPPIMTDSDLLVGAMEDLGKTIELDANDALGRFYSGCANAMAANYNEEREDWLKAQDLLNEQCNEKMRREAEEQLQKFRQTGEKSENLESRKSRAFCIKVETLQCRSNWKINHI